MMDKVVRRGILLAVVAGIVSLIVVAMKPSPVMVDTAVVSRGPLVVTVSDDGRTRIRERYVVAAPLSGRLVRISLKPGDPVVARETLLTTIEPTDPALLDPRAVAQARARVKAAEVRLNLAEPGLDSAKESLDLAEAELGRVQKLQERNTATRRDLDRVRTEFRQAGNNYSAARFEQEIAAFELEQARAALLQTSNEAEASSELWNFPVPSPISGQVLRVFQESSTVVQPGDRILELGDPYDLEVEVDVRSTDAVRIQPGARVMLTNWGGDDAIPARVRRIEPSAFTKVSALGIEEQRVNVIIDFEVPPEKRPPLGDGFRVEADIVCWESRDVLTVPTGALFREAGQWSVFVVHNDTIHLRSVELHHQNDDAAEVTNGLQAGDVVVLYPGDRVNNGSRVAIRTRANES